MPRKCRPPAAFLPWTGQDLPEAALSVVLCRHSSHADAMNISLPRAPAPAIYVDDAIHSWRGRLWAHLFSPDIEALHEFAARLGMRRDWFQQPPKASWPHYDLTESRRSQALRLGAVAADRSTTLEVAWHLQGTLTPAREARLAAYRASLPSLSRPAPRPVQFALPGL